MSAQGSCSLPVRARIRQKFGLTDDDITQDLEKVEVNATSGRPSYEDIGATAVDKVTAALLILCLTAQLTIM